MKIIVDNKTNVVVYPGLSDNLIQIENPLDRSMVLLDLSKVDQMIEALNKAREILEKRKTPEL